MINNKELTEEEIQNYILSDPNNEIMNLYQDKRERFNMHYYIINTSNHPIDQIINFLETFYQIL